jgi:hypothetical protein
MSQFPDKLINAGQIRAYLHVSKSVLCSLVHLKSAQASITSNIFHQTHLLDLFLCTAIRWGISIVDMAQMFIKHCYQTNE